MKNILEKYWIHFFGSPIQFSADPEFTQGTMQRFIVLHNIELCQRLPRANRNGKAERQNWVFKTVREKLERHDEESDPDDLIEGASFLTNIRHDSKSLSSIQMAMGYAPNILGMSRCKLSQELMDAHMKLTGNRAFHKVFKSRKSDTVAIELLKEGTSIYMYHRSSKHSEQIHWEEAKVINASDHVVKCTRNRTGGESLVAYVDIRLKIYKKLANELL